MKTRTVVITGFAASMLFWTSATARQQEPQALVKGMDLERTALRADRGVPPDGWNRSAGEQAEIKNLCQKNSAP